MTTPREWQPGDVLDLVMAVDPPVVVVFSRFDPDDPRGFFGRDLLDNGNWGKESGSWTRANFRRREHPEGVEGA